MSMTFRRKPQLPRVLLVLWAVVLCASTVACSSPTPGVRPSASSTSATPDAPVRARSTPRPDGPDIVQWGGHGRQLSIVVRNQTDRIVQQAHVLITALDHDGSLIAASSGSRRSTCCTVLGLPPGDEYGLYVDLPRPVTDVGSVLVHYLDVDLGPVTDKTSDYDVNSVRLVHAADDTVVETEVTVHGDVGRYLVGQAFLVDPEDRLVGVISGRFYCFGKNAQRRLRMQLLHPTPPGTHVERVAYFPIPAGVPTGVGHTCK